MAVSSHPLALPKFNSRDILQLYLQGESAAIAAKYLEVLSYFQGRIYTKLSAPIQVYLDQFLSSLFYIFAQPDFILSPAEAIAFIQCNQIIANLAYCSSHRTTDTCLKILAQQPHNLHKILPLYSPRNTYHIDYNSIFNTNPKLACYWYSCIFSHYRSGLAHPDSHQNLKNHLSFDHPDLVAFHNYADLFCGSSYIDPDIAHILKHKINHSLQQSNWGKTTIKNQPHKQKIAIVSGCWHPDHAIYRTFFADIKSLRYNYELTLIYFGQSPDLTDTSLFEHSIYLTATNDTLNIEPLRHNQFGLIYFLDLGESPESILLANLRLAPIQCCNNHHFGSSSGALIDYYLTNEIIDNHEDLPQFYSEQLVIFPHTNQIHHRKDYQQKCSQLKDDQDDPLIINCPWLSPQINDTQLQGLKAILEKSKQTLLFRFFTGTSLRDNSYLPLIKDIELFLPKESFEVKINLNHRDYMALMEVGDLTLDAYSIGNYQTVIDSLFLYQPTVVYQGDRPHHRASATLLKKIGLTELIATSSYEYIKLTLKLIYDANYRARIGDRLRSLDLQKTLFNPEDARYFKQAIDYLIRNHERLQKEGTKAPIIIPKD